MVNKNQTVRIESSDFFINYRFKSNTTGTDL